jgi:hypothetical protein
LAGSDHAPCPVKTYLVTNNEVDSNENRITKKIDDTDFINLFQIIILSRIIFLS